MKKLHSSLGATLAALAISTLSTAALASSHREAPAISQDPAADNTDLYAWVQGSNLVILANYIPLEEPAGGPNFHSFSDDVLYQIKIARGGADLDPDLTYQIRFKTSAITYNDPNASPPINAPAGGLEFFSQLTGQSQTYSVVKVTGGQETVLINNAKVAPANIGPRTNSIAYGIPAGKTYEDFFVDDAGTSYIASLGAGQGRVFAGPRDDGFYVDLGGVFDLAGLRSVLGVTPIDNVAGYNTHTIALEIPLTVANGGAVTAGNPNTAQTVGVWATASRRQISVLRVDGTTQTLGPWRQVSRLGLPLINEAVIGLQDKDRWNRLSPKDDLTNFAGYILNPIVVRDAEAVGFYAAGGPLAGCIPPVAEGIDALKAGRFDIVDVINLKDIPSAGAHSIATIGDVLRVDLGIASGFPNGRALVPGTNKEGADVTDVELSLILCQLAAPVPDGVNSNDATFKTGFPYLATPWEGFTNGHGQPAP